MEAIFFVVCFVIVLLFVAGYKDWRKFERDFPDKKFKGPAAVRYIKHMLGILFDGWLMGT